MQNQAIQIDTKARKALIEKFFDSETVVQKLNAYFAGDQAKVDRFRATMSMLTMSRDFLRWNPMSVLACGLEAAEIGLSVSQSMGLVYFVAYKGELAMTISYKGWQALLERGGKVCKSHAIYKCDEFSYVVDGFEENVKFVPNFDERQDSDPKWVMENLRGVLVMTKNIQSGMVESKFVGRQKLMQLRGASPSVKKNKFSPWTEYAAEMFMAKGIKYVVSKTPMEGSLARAVEIENRLEIRQNEDTRKRGSLVADELTGMTQSLPEPEDESQMEVVDAGFVEAEFSDDDFEQSQNQPGEE